MKLNRLVFLVFLLPLAACQPSPGGSDLIDPDDVVLVLVDGEPITLPMLEYLMSARGVSEDDHETMREILDELIRLQAVANAARSEGLDREPQVRARRMLRDLEALRLRYFDKVYHDYPVQEADIQAVYREQVERAGSSQYAIETIVFPDQVQALTALARIDDGEVDFEQLSVEARERGLLVDRPMWIELGQVPDDIAALLNDAEISDVIGLPLQTPTGFRVVRVSDTRPVEVPPLEDVREGIARHLVRQRLEALVEDLYQASEITPMLPLEEAN